MLDLLIITGASKGIGASIANQCSSICKNLIVISSSDKIYNIKYDSCNTITLQLNLSDYDKTFYELKNVITKINLVKSIGIVLCAAKLGDPGGVFSSSLESWDNTYKCNVLGNLSIIKACEEIIKSNAKTRIIFFGGGGAAFPNNEFQNYGATKCAIIRIAEQLSIELSKINNDASVISLAPGAVQTDMLKVVLQNGGEIRTFTDIMEPTKFCYNFLIDNLPSKELNGKFLHVRDDISNLDFNNSNMYKLRRIQ
jgi:short-subunit dehydrogenase